MRAWVHWRKVRRMDRPDLWTKRVALNLATSQFRRRRTERIVHGRISTGLLLEQLEEGGDRVAVRAALMRLTERQRTAILLRYLEDLSVEQTAELMSCSAGTVKKLTARGLMGLANLGERRRRGGTRCLTSETSSMTPPGIPATSRTSRRSCGVPVLAGYAASPAQRSWP